MDPADELPKITKITWDTFLFDHLIDQGHSQVGLPHPTGTDKQEAHILDRVVFHELFGDLDGMFVGFVMYLEVLERTVIVSFRDLRLLDKYLLFLFLILPLVSFRTQPVSLQFAQGSLVFNSSILSIAEAYGNVTTFSSLFFLSA